MTGKKQYEIVIHKGLDKEVNKLPIEIKEKFYRFAELLAGNPRPGGKGFRSLEKNRYRARLGLHHRMEWKVKDDERIVIITGVGPRERM